MKITILAFGTRGDVQPTLALGKALQARGHQVRMIAGANFIPWIEKHGLEAVTARMDMQAVMRSRGGQDWIDHGHNPLKQMRIMQALFNHYGLTMMEDAWNACQDAEVVVSSFTSDVYAASIAEKLGARHISTPLQPTLLATRNGAILPSAPFPQGDNVINYVFSKLLIEPYRWQAMGLINNRFRQETLGLAPQTYRQNLRALRGMLILQGYSPHVVPHPTDWPPNIHSTGYWFLDEDSDWQPPLTLLEFLHTGEPPVYVGFGSMTGRAPEALTQIIVKAVARSGQRAILQSGWAGMGDMQLPSSIFLLDAAPHHLALPTHARHHASRRRRHHG